MTWITGPKLGETRGYTKGQQKGKRQRGLWRRGIEWDEIDGTILYNVEAIDARADRIAAEARPARRGERAARALLRALR